MYLPKAPYLREIVVATGIALMLGACGGESSKGDVASSTSGISVAYITVSGSVGDGPVTGAELSIYDANSKLVTSTTSDGMANYSANVGLDAKFPLTVVARGGMDMVTGAEPTFDMISVIPSADARIANVNPFSTLISKMAAASPAGVSEASLQLSSDIVMENFGFGLDQKVFADPVATKLTEQNVAAIVKASEIVAEMFRRVHKVLHPLNKSATENEVIERLSADLIDGYLDGEGATGSNPLTAAVAKIIEAQVLVEALTNDLKVNGAWSTGAMDNAIKLIMPGSLLTTSSVDISSAMMTQADTALAAVNAVVASTHVDAVRQIITDTLVSEGLSNAPSLGSLAVSIKPTKLEPQLTYDLSADFQNALDAVTTDTTSTSTVNGTARNQKAKSTPVIQLISTDSAVAHGSATTLNWAASNSAACTASGGWSGEKPVSGTETTGAIISSTEYVLTCYGTYGRQATAAVSVSVTAAADTDGNVSNTPTPTPDTGTTTAPSSLTIRVNAGGSDYTDVAGNLWLADYGYNSGNAYSTADPVAGTNDDVLYQSERWDAAAGDELEYKFSVPNGRYLVNLHFMDRVSQIGWRIFSVQIEGRTVISNLDIYAEAGAFSALTKGVAVDVVDGQLNIRFLHVVENPKIDAMEIMQLSELTTNIGTQTTNPVDGTVSAIPLHLSWAANASTDSVLGYLVYYGGDENSVNIQASDIRTDSVGFSPTAPSVTYKPETDLGLQAGNRVCFKIRAYNADGVSGWSNPACSTIAQAI